MRDTVGHTSHQTMCEIVCSTKSMPWDDGTEEGLVRQESAICSAKSPQLKARDYKLSFKTARFVGLT